MVVTTEEMLKYLKLQEKLPFVSFVIPTYNRAKLLELTILSFLEQDYPGAFNILILDDGTDDTENVVKSFNDERVVYVPCPRTWIGDKLNFGILNSPKSEFLVLNGSDDITSPHRISVHIYMLLKHNKEFTASNKALFANIKNEKTLYFEYTPTEERPLSCGSTFGFSRYVWEKSGGFIKGWHKSGNDTFFVNNVLAAGLRNKMGLVDECFPNFYKKIICLQHHDNISIRFFGENHKMASSCYSPINIDLKKTLLNKYFTFKKLQEYVHQKISTISVLITCYNIEQNFNNIESLIRQIKSANSLNNVYLYLKTTNNKVELLSEHLKYELLNISGRTDPLKYISGISSNELILSITDRTILLENELENMYKYFLDETFFAANLVQKELNFKYKRMAFNNNIPTLLNTNLLNESNYINLESCILLKQVVKSFPHKNYLLKNNFIASFDFSLYNLVNNYSIEVLSILKKSKKDDNFDYDKSLLFFNLKGLIKFIELNKYLLINIKSPFNFIRILIVSIPSLAHIFNHRRKFRDFLNVYSKKSIYDLFK